MISSLNLKAKVNQTMIRLFSDRAETWTLGEEMLNRTEIRVLR